MVFKCESGEKQGQECFSLRSRSSVKLCKADLIKIFVTTLKSLLHLDSKSEMHG